MTDSKIVWDGWFSLDVPTNWQVDEGRDEMIIHAASGGVGAITASVHSVDPGETTDVTAIELAERFANQRGWILSDTKVQSETRRDSHEFEYLADSDESESLYWQVMVLRATKGLVLLTYNCFAKGQETEREVRRRILDSFTWID